MKTSKIVVTYHKGLPNYSHLEATVTIDADINESMTIAETINATLIKINQGFATKAPTPQSPAPKVGGK